MALLGGKNLVVTACYCTVPGMHLNVTE